MRHDDSDLAVIVQSQQFELLGANGLPVADLGTATNPQPAFGAEYALIMHHNDTTMSDSLLQWTYRDPAKTVKDASSVEVVELRGPTELPQVTTQYPMVHMETRTTPGNRQQIAGIDSGACTTGDPPASVYCESDPGTSSVTINANDLATISLGATGRLALGSRATGFLPLGTYQTQLGANYLETAANVSLGMAKVIAGMKTGDEVIVTLNYGLQQGAATPAGAFSVLSLVVNAVAQTQLSVVSGLGLAGVSEFDHHRSWRVVVPSNGAFTFDILAQNQGAAGVFTVVSRDTTMIIQHYGIR